MNDDVTTDKGLCDVCMKAGIVFRRRVAGYAVNLCERCRHKDSTEILARAIIGDASDE